MDIKILLTFNHELPLGKLTTNYNEALFSPSERIISLANSLDVKTTFFTDILCAQRFEEWDLEGFYNPYVSQLKSLINSKHDVQLLLRPHWLTSAYIIDKYYPSKDIGLGSFVNSDKTSVHEIVKLGKQKIEEICNSQNHKIIAFRAGNYILEPHSKEIFSALRQNDIQIDSSIPKGYYYFSNLYKCDFRKAPKDDSWFINPDESILEPALNGILEIPIATKPFDKIKCVKRAIYKKRKPKSHNIDLQVDKIPLIEKIKNKKSRQALGFENYMLSANDFIKMIDKSIKKSYNQGEVLITICSQPSKMGDYSFDLMKNFINKAREIYKENIEFTTFTEKFNEDYLETIQRIW